MGTKQSNYVLCTLFDSNYLDKGLVLYKSLEKYASDFTLYVLAMNNKCYEILSDLHYEHLVPVKLSDFENEDLLRVKSKRSVGEYCWTCSSSLIKYILDTYQPDYCSYLDADMAFYADPIVLIDEMKQRNASVSIVGHRFNHYDKKMADKVGTYCVECNTFKNDDKAKQLLNIWIAQCLEHCSIDGDGIYWADQKYMDNWVNDYEYCIETENIGAGIAPWNIAQYKLSSIRDDEHILVTCGKKEIPILFYHFENIQYLDKSTVKINVYNRWGIDDGLVKVLYIQYLHLINAQKDMLKKHYGLDVLIKSHPGVQHQKARIFSPKKILLLFNKSSISNIIYHRIPKYLKQDKDIVKL